METNQTFFQSFHWYYPADGTLWNHLAGKSEELGNMGITFTWLPPAYKSCEGPGGVGYGVYDLYDLGEFDQKGSVRTKYGTKDQYVSCVEALHKNGIKVVVDAVLNHMDGGDEKEHVLVEDQDNNDRTRKVGEAYERDIKSRFTFPGRQGKYSQFIWDFQCFSGINDPEDPDNKSKFYKIINQYGDQWDNVIGKEFGNFDYLLGADINFRNPAVQQELKAWIKWYYDTIKFDGVRLDAIKHMNPQFILDWLGYIRQIADKEIFAVAEAWTQNVQELIDYINLSDGKVQMFDVPLHYNFFEASTKGQSYDMRTLFDGTLMQNRPELCISFVGNHDTQPLQTLESHVDFWFLPLAYAAILLRRQGMPCVFYTSLYGATYQDKGKDGQEHKIELAPVPGLPDMIRTRKELAYGEQRDYFDHPNTIGWIREGIEERPDSGCAVVMTNGSEGYKDMEIGKRHAGQVFMDVLKNRQDEVTINEEGWARFPVNGGSVSVWIKKK